jgi:hypothetical protein
MKKRVLAVMLLGAVLLAGCGSKGEGSAAGGSASTSGDATAQEANSESAGDIVLNLELATGDEVNTTICHLPSGWELDAPVGDETGSANLYDSNSSGYTSLSVSYIAYENAEESAKEELVDLADRDITPIEHTFASPTGDAYALIYREKYSDGEDADHHGIEVYQPLPDNYRGRLRITLWQWPDNGKGALSWEKLSTMSTEEVTEYVSPFLFTGESVVETEDEAGLPVRVTEVANAFPAYEDPGFETCSIQDELYVNADEFNLALLDGVEDNYYTLYKSLSKSCDNVMSDEINTAYNSSLKELVNQESANNGNNTAYKVYESADGKSFVGVYISKAEPDYMHLHLYRQVGWVDYTEFAGEAWAEDHHNEVYREISVLVKMSDSEEMGELVDVCRDYLGVTVELQ